MRRLTILKQLPISPADFVVEIGAGSIPFQHTRLILDKYPFDNIERYGDIRNSAPVVKADALRLPLADRGCDVLFVSHVLEHLPEPERFLAEARRCASFVYLEFPTVRRELMYAWSFHPWLIEADADRLTFYKNDIPQLFGDFFHTQYDFLLDAWSEERFEELNHSIYRPADRLSFVFSPQTAYTHILERSARGPARVNYQTPYGRTGTTRVDYPISLRLKLLLWALTPPAIIRARARWTQRRNRAKRLELSPAILGRMCCQKCRGRSLRMERGLSPAEVVCAACGQRYTATQGVFNFDL